MCGEKPSITDHLTKLIKVRQLLSYDKIAHTIEMVEEMLENEPEITVMKDGMTWKEYWNKVKTELKKL